MTFLVVVVIAAGRHSATLPSRTHSRRMQLRPLLILGLARFVFSFVVVSHSVRMAARSAEGESKFQRNSGTPQRLLNTGACSKRSTAITAIASLDVSDSPSLTDESFKAVLAGCASLTSLSVAGCSELTDESIKAIASCVTLTSLDVSGCGKLTDEAIQAIAKGCTSLTSVNLSGCRNLTDQAIQAIASPLLVSLNVAYCGKLLTDESIKAVAAGCPSLSSCNVAGCKFLTDASMKALAAGCASLTSLDVSRCTLLTDESLVALAAGCPSLASLNVRNVEKLTDEAIRAVATLTELRTLRIFGCRRLTDESIQALAGCATLSTLDTTNTFRQVFKASRSVALGGAASGLASGAST